MIIIVILICSIVTAILYAKWKRTYRAFKIAESLLKTIEHTNDFFFYCKLYPNEQYKYLSPGFHTFFGEECVKEHLRNPVKTYLSCIHPDDVAIVMKKIDGTANYNKPFLFRIRTQQGTYRWFEEYATPIFDNGRLVALHGIYRDVDERVTLQKQLEYKAMHDQLTNVKNRTFFEEQLVKLNGQQGHSCGIIICDLDNLKKLNDHEGHKVGDDYIQSSARLLENTISANGHVCRIGGDEFAIVFEQLTREQLQQHVQRIEHALQHHNAHASLPIYMSIGYSFTSNSFGAIDDVFKEADAAMYIQKQQRKYHV